MRVAYGLGGGMTTTPPTSTVRRSAIDDGQECRFLIVDDCRMLRDALVAQLTECDCTVDVAWDFATVDSRFTAARPDVVLVNIASQDAAIMMRRSVELGARAGVIVYGLTEDDEASINACIDAGVAGYHLRSESVSELLTYIGKVLDGEAACSQRFSATLLRRLSDAMTRRVQGADTALTIREREVLRLVAEGLSNREIAVALQIAVHTVKNHVHNLLTKIGARSRAEAGAIYRRNGD